MALLWNKRVTLFLGLIFQILVKLLGVGSLFVIPCKLSLLRLVKSPKSHFHTPKLASYILPKGVDDHLLPHSANKDSNHISDSET